MLETCASDQEELQTAKHCAVYEDELHRVWPFDSKRQKSEIARFAQDCGWRLCSAGVAESAIQLCYYSCCELLVVG